MSCGGKQVISEGKGPVNQVNSGDDIFNDFRRIKQDIRLDTMNSEFDGMKQQFKKTGDRLDGLRQQMQQSHLAVEARANGEKTGERQEDTAVAWRNGDIQFTNRGQRLRPDVQEELSSDSPE